MKRSSRTQTLVLCALVAALLAVLAPVTVPIGPVPFSLALLVVFLAGALLPPLPACAAVAVYLCLGLLGLPVFSGFGGGPQVLAGPTGGFLVGYFAAALATSLAAKRTQKLWLRFLGALLGLLGCYLCGALWFMAATGAGFAAALMACVLPFALPDAAKAAAALVLARWLERRLTKGRTA